MKDEEAGLGTARTQKASSSLINSNHQFSSVSSKYCPDLSSSSESSSPASSPASYDHLRVPSLQHGHCCKTSDRPARKVPIANCIEIILTWGFNGHQAGIFFGFICT